MQVQSVTIHTALNCHTHFYCRRKRQKIILLAVKGKECTFELKELCFIDASKEAPASEASKMQTSTN
jgi:hypothetical protein